MEAKCFSFLNARSKALLASGKHKDCSKADSYLYDVVFHEC